MKKINWNEKINEKDYLIAILIASVIVLSFFVYANFIPKSYSVKKTSVNIIKIIGNCEECFDIDSFASSLAEKNDFEISSEEKLVYDSDEARKIIEKYEIKNIPSLIILSSEIDKISLGEGFSTSKDYAVFGNAVPYIDLETGNVNGLVEMIEIYPDCKECKPLSGLKNQLEAIGVKIKNYEAIQDNSEKASRIIKENAISFSPVLLISEDIEKYWWIFNSIENSFIKKDNYYILENPLPPYKDLEDKKIKGKVDITYIENKSCTDCLNISKLKTSFQQIGIYIEKENYLDLSSSKGKTLINKYNITEIPTVILSEEIKYYESLKNLLGSVGTFEDDEKFIFRKVSSLNAKYQKI